MAKTTRPLFRPLTSLVEWRGGAGWRWVRSLFAAVFRTFPTLLHRDLFTGTLGNALLHLQSNGWRFTAHFSSFQRLCFLFHLRRVSSSVQVPFTTVVPVRRSAGWFALDGWNRFAVSNEPFMRHLFEKIRI